MATMFKNGNHIIFALLLFVLIEGRKHHLKIEKDARQVFILSSFGFYSGGKLEIGVTNFTIDPKDSESLIGFSLEKTFRDKFNLDHHDDNCILNLKDISDEDIVIFVINTTSKVGNILKVGKSLSEIEILFPSEIKIAPKATDSAVVTKKKEDLHVSTIEPPSNSTKLTQPIEKVKSKQKRKVEYITTSTTGPTNTTQSKQENEKPVKSTKSFPIFVDAVGAASFNFVVLINKPNEEGLYNFYFHHCVVKPSSFVNFSIDVTEENDGNYLSAGEMPLPTLYFVMSTLFFLSGCAWLYILRKSKSNDVFKLHYLMLVLVYVKSTSMLFHGMNYHFIQKEGFHIEAWAVLYYITHLLKGTLLFITLVLIGTGWAFIKSILSDKDKKIFMIVLSLQVLANVALIIMEESEAGDSQYVKWDQICILVDLICCGAILFPVVWSIRHLQEASQVDGKAAISLAKLKMFRHFYIMIVCYIYFTRIIVYLLRITVPFQYIWLESLFKESGTLIFFILTGYKFRPASNNPYLQVPQEEDDEIEMEEVLTKTHITENLTKVGQTAHVHGTDASTKQESSHEYD